MKNCCDKIYKKIKMPDSFDFSMDRQVIKHYYKPVGYFFDKLPKLYYEDFLEMFSDYFSYIEDNCNGVSIVTQIYPTNSFYISLDVALQVLDLEYPINIGGCGTIEVPDQAFWVEFSTQNQNLGKWADNHPSFLRYSYLDYQYKSLGYYKNPTWLLNFNFCGTDGKFEDNKKFKLGGCNTFEVKWRLRVKPLLFICINQPTRPIGCYPMTDQLDETDGLFSTYEYSDYAQLVNLINATETKEGSRWLGLTPMRLESGIYNYDTGEQTPIVDSQSGYPQMVTNINHTIWQKEEKDKIQCKTLPELQETKLGPNAPTNINYYTEVVPSKDDILYYDYGGTGVYSESGFFTTQYNNLNEPGVFKINKQSLKIKGGDIEGVLETGDYVERLFPYIEGYVSPPTETAGITLNLEYNINGSWVRVLTQNYNVTFINLVENDNQVLIGTSPKSFIEYVNLDYVPLSTIYGDVDFITTSDYEYRYNLLIGFSKSYKKIDTFGSYTPKIQNFTKLSEEFTFELDGFTNVNLDKGDIGIYLKVLADSDNSHNINLLHKNDVVQVGGSSFSYPPNHVLCNNVIGSNECYPWGELGISSKSGWQKIENVEYFPLLPLNRNVFDNNLVNSILSDDEIARRNYRYNMDINPNAPALYLMIEEGWVSVEPTCENC